MDSLSVTQQLALAIGDGRDAIRDLVLGFKAAMPEVWSVLIRQVYVDALVVLGISLVVIAIMVSWRIWWKHHDWQPRLGYGSHTYKNDAEVAWLVMTLCISVTVGILVFSETLPRLLNPEYYAALKAASLLGIR